MNETDIYGVNPVFIFDPNNKSNRPTVSAVNPRTFWPAFPKFFQDAFITTFVQGLKDPSKRLMDAQWQDVLLRLRDEVSVCPRCGKDFLWKDGRGECCGNGLEKPKCLHIGDFRVPLFPKQRLYACHTQENGKDNFERQTGSITSKRLGIKNLSDDEWSYLLANGRKQCVRKDQVIPLDLMKEGIDAVMFNGVKGYIGEAPGFVLCLSVKDMTLTLSGGAKLRVCHTTQGTGDTPITGEVKFNKRTKDIHDLVICNYSDDEWTLIAPDGRSRRTLKKEEAPVPLRPGMMIQFMQGLTGTVSRI
jgi:hypothetical protein